MEQGSAAMASRGHARAAVPVTGCCRHHRRAAAMVVLGGLTGGQRCRRTTSGAARCGWHTSGEGRCPRGAGCWMLLFPFQPWAGPPWNPPADQRCSIKYANGLCRRHVFPCPWVSDVCVRRGTWMVCTFALVDLFGYEHAVKCLWKPWSSSFAWNTCACACSSRCARASCEIDPVVNGDAGVHSRPWWCTGDGGKARAWTESEYTWPQVYLIRPLFHRKMNGIHHVSPLASAQPCVQPPRVIAL